MEEQGLTHISETIEKLSGCLGSPSPKDCPVKNCTLYLCKYSSKLEDNVSKANILKALVQK